MLTTALVFFALRSEYVADKAHHYLLSYLEEKLQSRVEMGRPEIAWIRGSWYIKDVSIRPRFGKEKKAFVAAKSVRISFFPWFNVLNREIGISSIQLEEPSVYLRIENGKVANLPSLDFLKGPKGFFRFTLREIGISEGRMIVSYPERPMELAFNGIHMKVRPDVEKGQYGFILSKSSADIKVKEFAQKIISMKGDFSVTPKNLTVIKSAFLLPEGSVSAEGLYLDFATAKWVTKMSSKLNLAALKEGVRGQGAGVSKTIKDYLEKTIIKGEINLSATVKGDRDGFDINGEAKAGDVEMDGFRIRDTSSGFSGNGKWDSLKESPFSIEIGSKIPIELVNHYFGRSPRLKGIVDIHLKCLAASGQWSGAEKLKMEGDAASSRIELSGIPLSRISARFNADMEKINITDVSAGMLGGSLNGNLSLGLKDARGFNGKTHIGNIDLSGLSPLITGPSPLLKFSGKASGDINITGSIDPELMVDGSSNVQIEGLGVSYKESFSAKVPKGAINANVSYDGRVARIRSLEMETPASAVSASGDIVEGKLSLALNLNSSDLSEFGGYVGGTGTLKGKVSGPLSNPGIEGSLSLTKVSWGRYGADTFSGYMGFKDRVLSTTGLTITRGGSELSIKGELSLINESPRIDAAFELKKGRLEDVASFAGIDVQMRGELYARGKLKGGLRSLDGDMEIKGKKIVIAGEDLDAVNISGRLLKGRLFLDKGEALRDGKKVTVTGEIGPDGDSSLRVASSPLYISALPYIKKAEIPVTGTVEIVGEVTGNIKNPSFRGRASLKDVAYRNLSLGGGNLAFSLSDWRLTASGNAFGSEINGDLTLRDNKPFHVHMSAADLPLAPYMKGIERLEGMSGSISVTLDADGELSNLKGASAKGYISKFQLVRDPFFIKNTKDIEVELRDGRMVFRSFHLSGKGTEIDASGWMGIDGETNLLIDGRLDLYLLQVFTGIIDKGDGVADIRLAISGKPPKIGGKVVVKDGVIGFKGFEPLFTDISGNIALSGESLIIETLSGRFAEGRFKGEGTIEMAGISLKRTDVSFDLAGVHLSYPKWLPSEVEGNLRLTGDYPALLLSGDMNVVRARYSEKVDWRTFLPSFRQRLKEPAALREGEGALRVDINFRADRNLIFENNVGEGELKGEVRLKGDTSRLGIAGEVEVIRGKVIYKEHEFKITSGVIEFPDPKKFDAIFDFTAEGKVREYIIQILAQGNIKDFKVTMNSTPPLSDIDIASLLSFGFTTKEIQERGGGAPAYGAASILTREVEDKFKDYVGFDRFHIDPYYSKVTGTTEPKLTVGKELSEDASVLYSKGLSGTGEQEVQMEYRLFRNFSLMGGWSSFGASREGDLGADMKFRFEFR